MDVAKQCVNLVEFLTSIMLIIPDLTLPTVLLASPSLSVTLTFA